MAMYIDKVGGEDRTFMIEADNVACRKDNGDVVPIVTGGVLGAGTGGGGGGGFPVMTSDQLFSTYKAADHFPGLAFVSDSKPVKFVYSDGLGNWRLVTDNSIVAPMVTVYARGLALQGMESEGTGLLPGVAGTDYNLHPQADFTYYGNKGMTIFRIGYLWERLQPTLNGPLDEAYLGYLLNCIDQAKAVGGSALLDCHNYGRRRDLGKNGTVRLIGSPEVPVSALADMYGKLAARVKGRAGLFGYDIMNEPHDMLVPQRPGTYNPKRSGTELQYIPNYKFETNLSGWDSAGSAAWSRVVESGVPKVQIKTTAADNFDNFTTSNDWSSGIDLPAGTYTFSLTGEGTMTSGNYPQLQINTGTDSSQGHAFGPDKLADYRFTAAATPTRVSVSFTLTQPSKVWVRLQSLGGIGTYKFSATNLTPGPTVLTYRDFCFTGVYATSSLMYQAALTAIRQAGDMDSWCLIESDGYAGAHEFVKNFGANPEVWWNDPANKTMMSVHYYFDQNHSGGYATPWTQSVDDRLDSDILPVLQWGKAKGVKIFFGEYGVPPGTSTSDVAYQNTLNKLLTRLDEYEAYGTYFAGGVQFSSETTISPLNNYTTDRPQMAILRNHLTKIAAKTS